MFALQRRPRGDGPIGAELDLSTHRAALIAVVIVKLEGYLEESAALGGQGVGASRLLRLAVGGRPQGVALQD